MNTQDRIAQITTASQQERLPSPHILQAERAVRYPDSSIELYEVIGRPDGFNEDTRIYKCQKKVIKNAFWSNDFCADILIDHGQITANVLNLYESNASYFRTGEMQLCAASPALFWNDRMMAWPIKTDTGATVLAGIPLTPQLRLAKVVSVPSGSGYVTCNAILMNGDEAPSGQLGYGLIVYALFSGQGSNSTRFDSNFPYLEAGDMILIQNIHGKWYFASQFQEFCPGLYGCQSQE